MLTTNRIGSRQEFASLQFRRFYGALTPTERGKGRRRNTFGLWEMVVSFVGSHSQKTKEKRSSLLFRRRKEKVTFFGAFASSSSSCCSFRNPKPLLAPPFFPSPTANLFRGTVLAGSGGGRGESVGSKCNRSHLGRRKEGRGGYRMPSQSERGGRGG